MSESKVVKAGIGYTVGNYLLKGLNFLTLPIFSRLLAPADYGIFNSFVAYESILFVFIGLAIHTSFKNARFKFGLREEGAPEGEDYNSFVSSVMVFLCICLALWLTAANLLSPWLCGALELDIAGLNLMILFSFSSAVINCFNADAGIRYEYGSFLKVSAANALGNLGLSIALICTVFSSQRYMGRMLGATLPALAVAIFIIICFLRRSRPQKGRMGLSWAIKYSLPIVPHGISQVILSQFDRVMIHKLVSEEKAGIYSFAFNINLILTVTSQSLDTVWNQWFYEQMHGGKTDQIRKRGTQYMIGMLIFTGCLMLVSPELITVLGGSAYADARYCVIPVLAGGFFSFLYTLPSSVEYFREKTKLIALGTVCAAVINIVLNYFCILRWGYVAAAYTTLVTYMLYFAFHFIIAWRIEKKCLFSGAAVSISVLGILAVTALSLALMGRPIPRWALAVILGGAGLFLEERWLGLLKKFRK